MTLPSSSSTVTTTATVAPATLSQPTARRELRAPNWLQVAVILALLAGAVFVALDGRYLWCALLAVAGLAFGISYLLRRMVGDDYGRA